jgi:hypothetical protein
MVRGLHLPTRGNMDQLMPEKKQERVSAKIDIYHAKPYLKRGEF